MRNFCFMKETIDTKTINMLRDIPDLVPVLREFFEDWPIKVVNRRKYNCSNYLSPNRRNFYKILMITGGKGIFTLGLNTYNIEEPTLIFIHPNDIISWKSLSDVSEGYFVLFKKDYINNHPTFKSTMDKLGAFNDKSKSVIQLDETSVSTFNLLWEKMENEELEGNDFNNESIQAYMQLMMIESFRIAKFPKPDAVSPEFSHVYKFFNLLEDETSNINFEKPIKLRTAKEFATSLSLHPNYLNKLLKKYTGQNVSTHIRNRILDESKAMLLQTIWTLEEISYSVGFSDQPNFNFFFKKNTGITPSEFRKAYNISI